MKIEKEALTLFIGICLVVVACFATFDLARDNSAYQINRAYYDGYLDGKLNLPNRAIGLIK